MKKIVFLFLLVALSFASFSQKAALSKDQYLAKSKNQKTTAWIMLGGGVGLGLVGLLVGNGKESTFDDASTGVIVGGIGIVSMIGSIPLFIASSKNKKKGMALAFENQPFLFPKNDGFTRVSCPSLALKINFK